MVGKKGKDNKPVDLDDPIPDDEPPPTVSDVEKKLKDTTLAESADKQKETSEKKETKNTPKQQEEAKPKGTEEKETEEAKKPSSPETKKEAAPSSSPETKKEAATLTSEKKKEEAAPSSEKKKEEAAPSTPEKKKGKEDVPKKAAEAPPVAPPPVKKASPSVAPKEIPGKEVGTPKGSKGKAVSVWFGTNRKLAQSGLTFTNGREPDKNTYGRVDVEIAIAQRLEPEKTTSPLPLHRKKKHEDPPIVKQTEDVFFQDIKERLDSVRDMDVAPQVVVMLHNYNVGFFDCAISSAQLAEDLNIQGAALSYSWPSVGRSGNYETDSATLERSEPEIMDFLLKVVNKSGVDNVHVIADGKGCHGLLRVLQRISADQLEMKLGQVFLMAPDIDRELFENLAWLFPKYAERTTMYVSDHDRDVLRSVKRHKAPRAGAFEPYTVVPGVDTIAVSQLETDDVQSARVRPYEVVFVLHDMYDLMKNNDPPSRRLSLIKATSDGMTFWKYRK